MIQMPDGSMAWAQCSVEQDPISLVITKVDVQANPCAKPTERAFDGDVLTANVRGGA